MVEVHVCMSSLSICQRGVVELHSVVVADSSSVDSSQKSGSLGK